MKNYTSVNDILAAVKLELGIQDITNYDSWLRLRINEHIREFNCFSTYIKYQETLPIDFDGWVCLPDNFYRLGILRASCATEYNGTQVNRYGTYVYVSQNTLNNWGVSCNFPTNWGWGGYQIIGNRIKLQGDFVNVVSVNLCYEGYNTDEHGRFYAPKDFESAVMFRIAHNFMINPQFRKNYQSDTIAYYDAKALALFNQVKAKSNVRQFRNTMAQIMDVTNALLVDKNIVNY